MWLYSYSNFIFQVWIFKWKDVMRKNEKQHYESTNVHKEQKFR